MLFHMDNFMSHIDTPILSVLNRYTYVLKATIRGMITKTTKKHKSDTEKSNHLLIVYHKFKLKPQRMRRLTAEEHTIHKNFKKFHHRTELGIY